MNAVGLAILTMFIVILIYDQLFFRPLVCWSEKFTISNDDLDSPSKSWFLNMLQKSPLMRSVYTFTTIQGNRLVNFPIFKRKLGHSFNQDEHRNITKNPSKISRFIWALFITSSMLFFIYISWNFIYNNPNSTITLLETMKVFYYGLLTGLRVLILIIILTIIWVPIGLWIGQRPKLANKIQPYAQVAAAFPVNLVYGAAGLLIVKYDLNFNIWCIVLMALGTQWYIIFNVIAGASTIPKELILSVNNLQLKGIRRYTKFLFPAIMPYYITGAIIAAGGAWNASIVCEYINWGGGQTIQATGLGSYITANFNQSGNHTANIALGVVVMCILVVITNKLIWRPLYLYAEKRYSMNT